MLQRRRCVIQMAKGEGMSCLLNIFITRLHSARGKIQPNGPWYPESLFLLLI